MNQIRKTESNKIQTALCNIDGVSVNFFLTKICHCGNLSDKYRTRKFINKLDFAVLRVFYKCRICHSRITEDLVPKIQEMKSINILDKL